jgi:hypothetical protein
MEFDGIATFPFSDARTAVENNKFNTSPENIMTLVMDFLIHMDGTAIFDLPT